MIGCTALMALHLHEMMARWSGGSMVCNTLSVHIARGSKHWAYHMTSEAEVYEALALRVVVDQYGTRKYFNATGQLHREVGPAVICANGDYIWYLHGQLHRTDGPAIETVDGHTEWWVNNQRHREGGPAFIWTHGLLEWWQNGQRHREGGPAVVGATGVKKWCLLDIKYTEQEYHRQLAILRNTE